MRILFVTDQFPYPLHDGGNLRTFHVLAGLAKRHDVTLISHPPRATDALSNFPIQCRILTVPKQRLTSRITRGLMQRSRLHGSIFLTKNWSSGLLHCAENELQHRRIDAIHWNHLDTACFVLKRHWPQFKVFDTHNCLSGMASQAAHGATSTSRKWIMEYEASRLRRAETAICQRMDLNLVCSEVDAEMFRRFCPQGRFEVVPNGVDTQFFQPETGYEEEEHSIVFTGAMNYFPNEQAALFFCHKVLPRIRVPGAKVYLVGRQPTSRVCSLGDGCRVMVTGAVDDVRPYVQRSALFVAPLQYGSGTRLKILEAFAMGKAVVSTSVGAEGIPVSHGRELLLADTPEQFAKCIDTLLSDAPRRNAMGRAARDFVVTRFDWRSIQDAMCKSYTRESVPTPARQRNLVAAQTCESIGRID